MDNFEFVTVRGKRLEASRMWVGAQEFLIVAVPSDRADSAAAEVYSQQAIEIQPGFKVMEKSTGTIFEILSKPEGYSRIVTLKDYRRNLTPIKVPEDELRQNFRFVG